MNTLLHKSKLFFSVFFLLLISENINAQCTITGSPVINSSTLTCGTSPLSNCNGILYIGDGVTPTTVFMNSALNLTCLGAIQLIVRNGGGLDFSAGNDYLTLAEGSSVTFEAGGSLIGGSCNASERLYIGTNLLASCNGGAGADLSFVDLVSFGGTGSATSNSPVCVGNNIVLSATPPPNGTFTYKWTGPNSFTSTLQNPTPFTATTTPNTGGIYTVTMTRSDGKKIDAYTTVIVNSGTLPSAPTASPVQPTCSVATGTISVLTPTPDGILKYSINGLIYTNISGVFTFVSPGTYSLTAKNASGCISPALSVTINAQPTTPVAPTGAAVQSFCTGTSPTVASLSATGSGILWYAASSGGSPLATSDVLSDGIHYYASQTVSGCESTTRLDVTVAINTIPAAPTGTAAQSFCSASLPTIASLSATGSGILWYAASSGGSSLATSVALSNGIHYYASQTVNGCESTTRFDVTVRINTTPAAPTGTAVQSFCSASLPTVASLSATGSGILWYAAPSGGSSLATSVALSNGIHYYASQTVSGCESTTRLDVTVTINATPAAPTGTAAQSFCSGSSPTVASLSATGPGILWYAGPSGGSSLATSAALSNGIHYYASQTVSGCESAARFDVTVTINITPAAPIGTAAQSFCSGSSSTVASLNATGSGILWYAAPSGGSSLATSVALSNGIHYYASQRVSGCESTTRLDVTVTINATPAAPTGTAAQSFCSGSSPTVGSLSATGSGILWYAGPSGGSSLATSAALSNGIHYYASQTVSGCESTARFDVTATVNSIPTAPVLPSALALGCSAISFAANWTNSTGVTNYNLDVATDAGFSTILALYNNKALGNVISENVTGLTIGSTLYVRLRSENSCGTSVNSNTMVVSVPTTTYSAGTWDNGVPSSANNRKAIFASNYLITNQLEACSCRINSGVNVTVGVPGGLNDTATLKLENGLDVLGTLIFENNASLVQINNSAVNTGSIVYKRNTTPMKNFDYTYWSSPVVGQTLYALSPNTLSDKYLSFSLNTWVVETRTNVMTAGKGYIIRVPKPHFWPDPNAATYVQPVQFIGIPNNGDYSLPIDPVGYSNLIGNPYPSAMNADAFLLENSINNNRIQGTIRFWTHNTAINANSKYTATDYASYNYLGGVGTAAAPSASTGGANTNIPSGFIAAGQSFMTISAGAAGPVVFNNSMRVGVENKNTQFFKGTKSKSAAIEKHRVWLNLTNSEGAFKQVLVGYATGATNGFDTAFDGVSVDSNKYIDFYSVNDNSNYVIQGRALPFDKTDKVPLGYKTTIEGTFTISIDQADGALASQSIFVEDKVKGVIVDLKNGAYSFSTAIGTFNDRFVLRYIANDIVARTIETSSLDKPVIVSVQNHQIRINSFDQVIDKLMVYDLTGRLLYEKDNVDSNEFIIPNFNSSEQFLIVQTLLKNGEWFTTEIVY